MTAINFNAQQYAPQYGGGNGLPVGPNGEPQKYRVVISGDEQKPTSKGDGGYLQLEYTCIEGPMTGQKQVDNLNLWNPSPKASEIANKQLSAICHAVGVFVVNDTHELYNKPFMIEVRRQKNNPEYTEVGAVFDVNGNEPGKAGAAPVQAAPPPQAPPQVAPAAPAAPGWGAPAAQAGPPAGWVAPAAEPSPQAHAHQAWAPAAQQQAPAPAATGWSPPGAVNPAAPAAAGWANR